MDAGGEGGSGSGSGSDSGGASLLLVADVLSSGGQSDEERHHRAEAALAAAFAALCSAPTPLRRLQGIHGALRALGGDASSSRGAGAVQEAAAMASWDAVTHTAEALAADTDDAEAGAVERAAEALLRTLEALSPSPRDLFLALSRPLDACATGRTAAVSGGESEPGHAEDEAGTDAGPGDGGPGDGGPGDGGLSDTEPDDGGPGDGGLSDTGPVAAASAAEAHPAAKPSAAAARTARTWAVLWQSARRTLQHMQPLSRRRKASTTLARFVHAAASPASSLPFDLLARSVAELLDDWAAVLGGVLEEGEDEEVFMALHALHAACLASLAHPGAAPALTRLVTQSPGATAETPGAALLCGLVRSGLAFRHVLLQVPPPRVKQAQRPGADNSGAPRHPLEEEPDGEGGSALPWPEDGAALFVAVSLLAPRLRLAPVAWRCVCQRCRERGGGLPEKVLKTGPASRPSPRPRVLPRRCPWARCPWPAALARLPCSRRTLLPPFPCQWRLPL